MIENMPWLCVMRHFQRKTISDIQATYITGGSTKELMAEKWSTLQLACGLQMIMSVKIKQVQDGKQGVEIEATRIELFKT